MRAESSCERPVGPNAARSLSTTFALFVVLLLAGCTTTIRYRHASGLAAKGKTDLRVAVYDFADLTNGEHTMHWDKSAPWTYGNLSSLSADVTANVLRGCGYFNSVDRIRREYSDEPSSAEPYDVIVAGEIGEFKAGGCPHATVFINPISLLYLVGLPTAYCKEMGANESRVLLIDRKMGTQIQAFFIRSSFGPKTYWEALWSMWRDRQRRGQLTIKSFAEQFEKQLNQRLRAELGQTLLAMAGRVEPSVAAQVVPVPATRPEIKPRPVPPVQVPAAIRNVHVLVIGEYEDPQIPKLRCTALDAQAVYQFFKSSPLSPARPANVYYLGTSPNEDGLRATQRGIRKANTRYLVNKAVHKDDMALLYFAGHGDTGKRPAKGTEYYLIPADAERADLFNTAIELSAFKRLWSAIRAETKVLIADACNSGGFTGVRGVGGTAGLEAVGRGKIVLSASKADQKSLEVPELGHGLFTYVLLQGLNGKADMVCGDNDGRVTAGELKRYLDEQVPVQARRYGGSQTPVTQMLDAWGKVYLTR